MPNLSEINRMLARDEEELDLYEKFDQMRYEQEKLIYPNFSYETNYRLITEAEVPARIRDKKEKKKVILGKRRNYRELYNIEPEVNDEISESPRKKRKKGKKRNRGGRGKKVNGRGRNGFGTKGTANGKNGAGGKVGGNDDIFVDSDE